MPDRPTTSTAPGGSTGATRVPPAVILPPWQARLQPRPANDNKAPMRLRLLRGAVMALTLTALAALGARYFG